ncbi:hypothetical protein PQU94_08470 [Asticcacaulis sp. DXS10W]|uniref:Uncharacterized protein n=1 Tax=Asticcacaulis currens TaxID=2984210 RepID=A0ABT5IDS2_9CAUL|nr:hypothetical protein [Asticcacaulis currens]MDC7694313.1 hypothetical protein [Asticcacaulis currens]
MGFDDLVNALDLALCFLQMLGKTFGQLRMGGGARQLRQRLGQLLFGAVDIGQFMDKGVLKRFDLRHIRLRNRGECRMTPRV